jgi:hypothetical protein
VIAVADRLVERRKLVGALDHCAGHRFDESSLHVGIHGNGSRHCTRWPPASSERRFEIDAHGVADRESGIAVTG